MAKNKNRNEIKQKWITGLFVVGIIYMQHVQLNYSTSVRIANILFQDIRWQMLDLVVMSLLFLLVTLLLQNVFLSLVVSCVVCTLMSLANYYTTKFHGSPFLASDVFSIKTAMAVAGQYHFALDAIVLRLLCIGAAEGVALFLYWLYIKHRGKNAPKLRRKSGLALLLTNSILLWGVFLSPLTLFPKNLIRWSWTTALNEYGYGISLMNSAHSLMNRFEKPNDYSAQYLSEIATQYDNGEYLQSDSRPDIILILNETLCDLDFCSDIPEGKTVLNSIRNAEDVISGYSTVSLVGGGTNNSEYELLFSNSMAGLQYSAPFTLLDLRGANSVVSYLKSLGYNTVAMHCGALSNYNRSTAYKAMGFDEIYLGDEWFDRNTFFTYNKNGNRPWLDSDNYSDMLGIYETMSDEPRFIYLLTYQNHGDYEQNDPSMDTINVAGDYGEYTDDVNELLSSLQKSSEAFLNLIENFSSADRPVIILMVGDHEPSIIPNLPVSDKYSNPSVTRRTVPYFVWANVSLDETCFSARSTMTDLVPMLVKSTKMPLPPYYELICELNQVIPVRTADGIGVTKDGKTIELDNEQIEGAELVKAYNYMEYNNLLHGDDYCSSLFTVR